MLAFQKPYIPAPETIGICGTAANSGATYFSVALCSYLHGRYMARTAYLEVNASRAIRALSKKKDTDLSFSYQGVSYYPEVTIRELPERLQMRCRYKVLDFGVLTPYTMPAFAQCDRQIVMTNAGLWKTRQLTQFLDGYKQKNYRKDTKQTITFFAVGAAENDIRQLSASCGVRVIPIPFLKTPFHVSHRDFGIFENIWKG